MAFNIFMVIFGFILGCINFGSAAKAYKEEKYGKFGVEVMFGLTMVFIYFKNYVELILR